MAAYRRRALELHPDRHGGSAEKEAQFKRLQEAYSVLGDAARRRRYDAESGHYGHAAHRHQARHHAAHQRSRVYAPAPPPAWNGRVWHHRHHFDMHYGDGFQREAMKRMREEARKDPKATTYRSPLGRGFTFDHAAEEAEAAAAAAAPGSAASANASGTVGGPSRPLYNPYSKAPQGPPPAFAVEYEEVALDVATGREHVSRRERIVEDMYQRRQERYSSSAAEGRQRAAADGATTNAALARRQPHDCVIL